jgi:hypothetical protein
MTAKRSHTEQMADGGRGHPAPPPAQGQVSAFFADLFIHLNLHLERAETPAGKALVVQEARHYLRGAEALWDCTKALPAVPDAGSHEGRAAGQLLERLFLDAHAYIGEIENQLAQAETWPESFTAACREDGEGTQQLP